MVFNSKMINEIKLEKPERFEKQSISPVKKHTISHNKITKPILGNFKLIPTKK